MKRDSSWSSRAIKTSGAALLLFALLVALAVAFLAPREVPDPGQEKDASGLLLRRSLVELTRADKALHRSDFGSARLHIQQARINLEVVNATRDTR